MKKRPDMANVATNNRVGRTASFVMFPLAFAATGVAATGFEDALNQATVNGAVAGTAILTTCRTGDNGQGAANNQAFQNDCNIIVGGASSDAAGSAQAVNGIAASQVNAENSAATRTTTLSVAVIANRLEQIRLASGLPAYRNGTALASNGFFGQTGGGASSDVAFGPFGGFLNAQYVDGSEDRTRFQGGYGFHGWNLAGGVDYRFNDALVGGAYVQYWTGDADFDNNGGTMDTRSWGGALYGTYFLPSGLYFDGLVSYASNDYDLKRNVFYTIGNQTANQVASSSPNADVWNISLGAGYTMYRGDASFTPLLRFTYLNNSVGSYSEQMSNPGGVGGSMAQAFDSQTFESFRSNLGFQIAKAFSTANGVFSPQLTLTWVHEYLNDQQRIGTRFANDINATPFYVATNDPERDYFDLGVGVSAQFAQGRSGFISYTTLLGYQGVSYNAVNAGVRIEF